MVPADQCGVYWVRVFHLYRGGMRKVSRVGNFEKVSAILTKVDNFLKKKTKLQAVLVRLKKQSLKKDRSWISFKKNSLVLLKKRLTPRGKELLGPADFNVRRKKFTQSFSGSI